MPITQRQADLLGRFKFDLFGGGSAVGARVFSNAPRLLSLKGRDFVDLSLFGADVFIQFGDENVLDEFDPALALYYPVTSGYGVEKIGIPVGATHMAVMAVQPTPVARLAQQAVDPADFDDYGGAQQTLSWNTADTTLIVPLNASITALPVTIIGRFLSSNTVAAARSFAALLTATNTASSVPRMGLRITGSGSGSVWNALYQKDAANNNQTGTTDMAQVEDDWATVIAEFTDAGGGVVQPDIWRFDATSGETHLAGVTPTQTFTGTYTRLSTGGLVHATGQSFVRVGDLVAQIMVYAGTLTTLEKQQFRSNNCPPWNLLVSDPTLIRAWCNVRAQSPRREVTTGKLLTAESGFGTDSHVDAATYNGPDIRGQNRLVEQDVNGTLYVPYSNAASGVQQLPALGSSQWRAHAHHALRYDDTDPTGAAGTYAPLAAGVSLLYSAGGAIDLNVINDSGSASDTGSLSLTGLGFTPVLYEPDQVTALGVTTDLTGTVTFTGSGQTLRYGRYTPSTGSGWPLIYFACGKGGMYTEYGGFATYWAQRGYCVVIQEFPDNLADGDPFIYPTRMQNYQEFLSSHLSAELGYLPSEVVIAGHSGGSLTSLIATGATYWNSGGNPVHTGLVSIEGGGTVIGSIQLSGQGIQALTAGAETRAGTWATIEVPVVWFSGIDDGDDDGTGGFTPTERVVGYTFAPEELPCAQLIFNTSGAHHLYGGACTRAFADVEKPRDYIMRLVSENVTTAVLDYFRGSAGAYAYLTGEMPNNPDALIGAYNHRFTAP